jgi:hypothetical protein
MRFDNGKPWGNPGMAVPTSLALWLVGLGIQPIYGRPRQSTDNAVVERCHGVLASWVEPHTCDTMTVLQERLDYYVRIQREVYPVQAGRSRREQFPTLSDNPQRYDQQWEETRWDLERVLAYVAGYTFTRLVEKNGRITLMTHEYTLGRQYHAQQVTAQLNPHRREWVMKDRYGEVVGCFPALQLNYLTIAGMTLTYKHFKGKLNGAQAGV